jgi:hypothetical protein
MEPIVIVLLVVYLISLLISGSIHWAGYQDELRNGRTIDMQEKVMKLYVVPLCPVVNTLVTIGIITDYFGM